jgi:hypothetical protein
MIVTLIVRGTGQNVLIIKRVGIQDEEQLVDVALANGATRFFFRSGQGGQQEGRQDTHHNNNHRQFHQGKPGSYGAPVFPAMKD